MGEVITRVHLQQQINFGLLYNLRLRIHTVPNDAGQDYSLWMLVPTEVCSRGDGTSAPWPTQYRLSSFLRY